MTFTKITSHTADALNRMLSQFKNQENMESWISLMGDRAQEIEDALYPLYTERTLFSAIGAQLDGIGGIVGLARPAGFTDEPYRLLILAKIGVNVSQGDPEKVIEIYNIATNSSLCLLQELYPAGVYVSSDNEIDQSLVDLLFEFSQNVVPTGVRIDHYGFWYGDEAFAMEGGPGQAYGFGDVNDVAIGGKLGSLYVTSLPEFSFEVSFNDENAAGFGSLDDPILGGKFKGV